MSILVVGINAMILSTLTDRYFTDYLNENYNLHIEQILKYTRNTFLEDDVSYKQMAIELETHLNDPIIQIKVYNKEGDLLVDVSDDYHMRGNMMGRNASNEVIQYDITDNSGAIGKLNVTLHSVAENSFVARRFKGSLLINSLYSMLIAIGISLVTGIFISKKMSNSLQETAKIASDIQIGAISEVKPSFIKEVNAIRESLGELNTRLKLKQKSRKVLIDQLVHETRTPLTILKSYLEAKEDGLIEFTDEEIGTCQKQIEDITAIIANMRSMIDANKENDMIYIEEFEFNKIIKQIIAGLSAQFAKKNITLKLISDDKIKVVTDKAKLSQSIYNLITNAYKYTENNGEVIVSYAHTDTRLIIKIQDTGVGINSREQEKIFTPYYRVPSSTYIEGDGIGLYIVKNNLEKIGGAITVKSKVKAGSIFVIEIPISLSQE
ncbi:MAG: HAMP domain-containing sensor histidine kinase [Proteocatella sp.]